MKHKKYRVLILAMALLILGTREVCMAQFSQHTLIEKSRLKQSAGERVEKQKGVGFAFRVKRFVLASPTYQHIAMQPPAGTNKKAVHRLSKTNLWNLWMDWWDKT